MSDAAPAKGKLCLGHFVALAGLGLGLAVLIWQWIWALSVTKGAGPVINLVLQFLLLAVLLAACAVVVVMTRKNARLVALVYILLGALFLMVLLSVSSPFKLLPIMPDEGRGLNPLLRNFWMIIHPPIVFVGYVKFA